MEKIRKIDIHAHSVLNGQYELPSHTGLSPEDLITLYDELGVEKGILLPITSPEGTACVMSNGNTKAITTMYPGRLLWACNVDPRLGRNSPDTDLSEYLEFYKSLGAVSMGELTANIYADDPMMENLFSCCEECDMAVTIHIAPKKGGYGIIDDLGLPRLEKMLKRHPKLKIFGHSQPFWAEISSDCSEENRGFFPKGKVTEGRIAHLLRDYPNLYCDLSAYSGFNALSRDIDYTLGFIEEFWPRIMYGIDACTVNDRHIRPMASFLDSLYEKGDISEEAYRGICRENAERILKLDRFL